MTDKEIVKEAIDILGKDKVSNLARIFGRDNYINQIENDIKNIHSDLSNYIKQQRKK